MLQDLREATKASPRRAPYMWRAFAETKGIDAGSPPLGALRRGPRLAPAILRRSRPSRLSFGAESPA